MDCDVKLGMAWFCERVVNELSQALLSDEGTTLQNKLKLKYKELLEVDKSVCKLKGREERIPLHYAVIKGRVLAIRELLSACAVNNNQFEAFKVLVEHLKQFNEEDVLNIKDKHTGNIVLHIAVSRKQEKDVGLEDSHTLMHTYYKIRPLDGGSE
ncbi:hypothetical protein HYC85_010696 [Camellia sinensis]|uniref:Uncharacterized protein n=1 Tax=Camellia sinensis TaxID=4442 RepID=A0A7J7HIL7_CAMSI|nr:hypothetical protein HYC85_010696 [Camellia sinensis]